MDQSTIGVYNSEAKQIAELHAKLRPSRIYELINQYFHPRGNTVDVGCGIGRDVDWLARRGYQVVGVDGAKEMLKQARNFYPERDFIVDLLPSLEQLKIGEYQNILCSAVLMHLTSDDLMVACKRLVTLMAKNAILVLSFRGSAEIDNREKGKLYEPIDTDLLVQRFVASGLTLVLLESEFERERHLTWHNLVFKK